MAKPRISPSEKRMANAGSRNIVGCGNVNVAAAFLKQRCPRYILEHVKKFEAPSPAGRVGNQTPAGS
jgi:hypothetical protein